MLVIIPGVLAAIAILHDSHNGFIPSAPAYVNSTLGAAPAGGSHLTREEVREIIRKSEEARHTQPKKPANSGFSFNFSLAGGDVISHDKLFLLAFLLCAVCLSMITLRHEEEHNFPFHIWKTMTALAALCCVACWIWLSCLDEPVNAMPTLVYSPQIHTPLSFEHAKLDSLVKALNEIRQKYK
jgi:hypothetical protein